MKLTHLSDESSQWCFNIIENKKLPCFNQAFKEQVNAQFGFFSPVKTIDPKIDEIYQTTDDNIKKMINCMKTTMNEQKRFAFEINYSLSSSSKDINYLYLPVMENLHEWLKTFLDKTIRDAEDSVTIIIMFVLI
ncbi:hypothetical protein H8356DRAFT_1425609 [Neocallimastix lanati (nom. inval.)]|nr:hypothetical protein H8356DRAFT_1439015 [Neocallimastix sp. JGI-2020a]KAG4097252.1 hypothetical protein H8356DRAFT_1425609 [Neocallimastix sp. JGI-2020a]